MAWRSGRSWGAAPWCCGVCGKHNRPQWRWCNTCEGHWRDCWDRRRQSQFSYNTYKDALLNGGGGAQPVQQQGGGKGKGKGKGLGLGQSTLPQQVPKLDQDKVQEKVAHYEKLLGDTPEDPAFGDVRKLLTTELDKWKKELEVQEKKPEKDLQKLLQKQVKIRGQISKKKDDFQRLTTALAKIKAEMLELLQLSHNIAQEITELQPEDVAEELNKLKRRLEDAGEDPEQIDLVMENADDLL
jgi:hypothetical protein